MKGEGQSDGVGLRFPQLQLQFFVVTVSVTAILGKWISIPAVNLVFWRTLMAAAILALLGCVVSRYRIPLASADRLKVMGNGLLLGAHWITFFWAIKLSNVSVCLIGMATTSVFTAFSEALVQRRAPRWREVALGIAVIPGIAFIAGNMNQAYLAGFFCSCVSAALAAVFPVINKQFLSRGLPVLGITFWQMCSASVLCAVVAYLFFGSPVHVFLPQSWDWLYLTILAGVCTVFAFSYHLYLLKHFSAFAVNLAINFEPVYGILLAAVIFKEYEELSLGFFVGAAVIVVANLLNGFYSRRSRSRENS